MGKTDVEPMEIDEGITYFEDTGNFIDLRYALDWEDCTDIESDDEEEEKEKDPFYKQSESGPSLQVLGKHLFKNTKTLPSIPKWAQNAIEFNGKIEKRSGEGIEALEGLNPTLAKVLQKHISVWFPVQTAVLPKLLVESVRSLLLPAPDYAISAPTGSGKTLCYLLPILNSFSQERLRNKVFALIVAPTRNLVSQIEKEFEKLNAFNTKIIALNSKWSYEDERKKLFPNNSAESQVQIIISTPDRLVKHLSDSSGAINLKSLRYLVVDEADGMLLPREQWLQMVETLANYPTNHKMTYSSLTDRSKNTSLQKILVSATLSLEADKLHHWNLRCPRLYKANAKTVKREEMEIKQEEEEDIVKEEEGIIGEKEDNIQTISQFTLPQRLKQEVKICQTSFKPLLVYAYLKKETKHKKFLVFVNTISSSQRLKLLLQHLCGDSLKVAEMSSNVFGRRRFRILKAFTSGDINVVISAGSLGRGIDIPDIDCVINYDPPSDSHQYVHRAGRTARAGRKGKVVTLVTKEEKLKLKKDLVNVGIWDSEAENREKDEEFIDEYREQYQQALTSLKEQLSKIGKK